MQSVKIQYDCDAFLLCAGALVNAKFSNDDYLYLYPIFFLSFPSPCGLQDTEGPYIYSLD